MSRAELVAAAGESIRHGSKSFHMASRLFDRTTRERAWLLYCWCRHCDDVCDGQALGHRIEGAPRAVGEVEFLTRRVLAGERTGLLPFDSLGALLAECPLPHRYILDHLEGFALDARGWRPSDEADLLRYCYRVAGAVGCMMAVVMGVPADGDETLARASDLGIAFQLSNIARDLRDDHEAGRCYLPADWIDRHGLDLSDPLRLDQRETLVALGGRLTSLALRYEASAHAGVARLPFRARWAVLAAARVYGAIGRRVASLGAAAWETRVVVPRREKLAFLLPTLVQAMLAR
jgi:15-cis-phytoene synthase